MSIGAVLGEYVAKGRSDAMRVVSPHAHGLRNPVDSAKPQAQSNALVQHAQTATGSARSFSISNNDECEWYSMPECECNAPERVVADDR